VRRIRLNGTAKYRSSSRPHSPILAKRPHGRLRVGLRSLPASWREAGRRIERQRAWPYTIHLTATRAMVCDPPSWHEAQPPRDCGGTPHSRPRESASDTNKRPHAAWRSTLLVTPSVNRVVSTTTGAAAADSRGPLRSDHAPLGFESGRSQCGYVSAIAIEKPGIHKTGEPCEKQGPPQAVPADHLRFATAKLAVSP